MISLQLPRPADRPLRVLCLGAHSDDIEIGCGGTLLRLLREQPSIEVRWVVFSAPGARRREAEEGARRFLEHAGERGLTIHDFRDGYFPFQGSAIKEAFEEVKGSVAPDVIFTHHGQDFHQDHRLISDLTWNTFRNHLILEYEIPKYDGGLATPNLFCHLDPETALAKVEHLLDVFATQRSKQWFSEDTFQGLMRIRGVESAAPQGRAEGFHARKIVL